MKLGERWQAWVLRSSDEDAERAAVLRVAFFGVLAVDCWENIAHLGRYGAGHFNVSHIPWADALLPAPESSWFLVLVLSQVFLSLRAALGIALRQTLPLLALSYSVTYFWSQLDSYQHHYLVAVLLWIFAAGVLLERRHSLPAWSLRGAGAIVSVLYFWAAVAKADPLWLDGQTLSTQITLDWARAMLDGHYAQAAWAVLVAELALAVAWQVRRAWPFALVVGLSLHLGIEVLDFKIGVFSYFMVALYSLLLPASWLRGLCSAARSWLPEAAPARTWERGLSAAAVALGWALLPFQTAAWVSALAVASIALWGPLSRTQVVLQGLTVLLLHLAHHQSDVARDYYRYIGGDTRRRGQVEEAIEAYSQVTRLDPTYVSGHVRLGDLYARRGEWERALAEYEAAQALEPQNPELPARLSEAALNARP